MVTQRVNRIARSQTLPYYLVRNARIAVRATAGLSIDEIALRADLQPARVRQIIHRYYELDVYGLYRRRPISYKGKLKPAVLSSLNRRKVQTGRSSKPKFVNPEQLTLFSSNSF